MELIATATAHAYNNEVPYQSLVQSDSTIYLAAQDVLAMAYLSNFQVPFYPSDVYVQGAPPNPALDSGAHAYVSRYRVNGSSDEVWTLNESTMADAAHLAIPNATSVTFTALVLQGWMSMIGMLYSDPPAIGKWPLGRWIESRVVYDGATGDVHYVNDVMVLDGADAPDAATLDATAVEAARRNLTTDPELRLLTTDRRPNRLGQLRVDLDTGRLVHTPPTGRPH